MATQPSTGYRNYSADGTYWTVRKHRSTFWVVRIDNSSGGYRWVQVWGGYASAGAAGGAAALLAYRQAVEDTRAKLTEALHGSLESIGLGVPEPAKPSVPPSSAPKAPVDDESSESGI